MEYELCRKNINELCDWYYQCTGTRNEATTRLQIIDKIFFECLGWDKNDDVVLEESQGGEYADYTFSTGRRVLIVEAKKEGNYFEIPAGRESLEYSLRSLIKDHPSLGDAIRQVAGYCQSRGVQVAAVCNGNQLVAFVGTRSDGLAPLDGKALVFPSLEFMCAHYLDLWQSLSKPGVEEKHIIRRLIGNILPEVPPKPSKNIPGYPGNKARNIFQTDLQILSELVLEDLINQPQLEGQFLEECYCQSGALSQHSLSSKVILQARYAALFEANDQALTTIPISEKDGISQELLAESFSRRPILLIGDVGVGKTTFIRHLIKVDAANIFERAITLYIDLGSQAVLAQDTRGFVIDEITRQLYDNFGTDVEERNFVRGVYNIELQRFRRGIYSDLFDSKHDEYVLKEIEFLESKIRNKEQHLRASFEHISRGQKKQIVIFLDNADQRSEDTQQLTFLIAQEFSEHWPATVFVTLRPETYHKSLRFGALSGYHSKAFTISPPRVDVVIQKRLQFALRVTGGEIPIQEIVQTVKLINLDSIIKIFLDSIKDNRSLIEFIDNISGGNIRLALGLLKMFFGSGHVDTQKIIDIYQFSGRYTIPLHEFLRAVIYGDNEYYSPDLPIIVNLFDISSLDYKEHFLLPLVIGCINAVKDPSREDGFIETSIVYEEMQGLGYTPDQIDIAISKGCKTKLLQASRRNIPQPGQELPKVIRATTTGKYHVYRLCALFSYIDAMVVDTPILDDNFRKCLHPGKNILERAEVTEDFCNYLDFCWSLISSSKAPSLFNWPEKSETIKTEIVHIRKRVFEGG